MAIDFVSTDTAVLYTAASGNQRKAELLWGDRVEIVQAGSPRSQVKARGKTGFVKNTSLGGESLLEVYFIDVGQGDGVLIRTPDDRHIMIDGGYKRASQPSGKNAADFVDWKFFKDYGSNEINLDVMIASHNDADHYGGLADLLDTAQNHELDAQVVTIENFYHAGVGWWVHPTTGVRWLGETTADGKFRTQLVGKRPDVVNALKPNANPKLQGEWAAFLKNVTGAKTKTGSPTPINRLSQNNTFLPGYTGANGGVAVRVLAPFETDLAGKPGLHNFGSSDSINTNGNSILLRLDYGRTRMLLTGDLNSASQRTLLDDYTGNRIEFQCDIGKACHHGSDDVSYEFLSAMRPAVTVISSGDNEGHDHPRPGIVAASATTGYLEISNDRIVSPLIYSTELARSSNLGKPFSVTLESPAGDTVVGQADLGKVKVDATVTKAGDLNPTKVQRTLDRTYIVAGLIYGLVNVRTNGSKIICATLGEKDASWEIKTLSSRF